MSAEHQVDLDEFDFTALSHADRKKLLSRSLWLDLKDRLREFTLALRGDNNTHLLNFFLEADQSNHSSPPYPTLPPPGTLDLDDVIAILTTLDFPFTPPETANSLALHNDNTFPPAFYTDQFVLQSKFCDFKDHLNYVKLYESLDLEPPRDYSDPDHFTDPLPQPYRLIAKTLETILDDVWERIRERHPPLKELPVTNPELYGLGPPRKVVDIHEARHCNPTVCVDEFGAREAITAIAYNCTGTLLTAGTTSGYSLLLLPKTIPVPATGGMTGMFALDAAAQAPDPAGALGASAVLTRTGVFTDCPSGVSHSSAPALFKGATKTGIRVAVATPVEVVIETPDDVDNPTRTVTVSKIAVTESWQGATFPGHVMYSSSVIATATLHSEVAGLALSDDGAYLCVNTLDGGVCGYTLPKKMEPVEGGERGRGMRTVVEGGDTADVAGEADETEDRGGGEGEGSQAGKEKEDEAVVVELGIPHFRIDVNDFAPPKQAPPAASVATGASKSKGGKSAPATDANVPPPATELSQALKRTIYTPTVVFLPGPEPARTTMASVPTSTRAATIAVWRANSNVWKVFKLPGGDERPAVKPETEEIPASKGKPAKGAELPSLQLSVLKEADLTMLGRYIMPSAITCSAMSSQKNSSLLAFGCEDGGVVLWDCKVNAAVGGCSRMLKRVTVVEFVAGERYLVSGDAGGTLHFHDLDEEKSKTERREKEAREKKRAMSVEMRRASSRGSISRGSMTSRGSVSSHGTYKNSHAKHHVDRSANVMKNVLRDPRSKVGLITRRDEDFSTGIVNISAAKAPPNRTPAAAIVVVCDDLGTVVVYDASVGDLVGKLSSYPVVGNAHDANEEDEGYTKILTVGESQKLCRRQAVAEDDYDEAMVDGGPSMASLLSEGGVEDVPAADGEEVAADADATKNVVEELAADDARRQRDMKCLVEVGNDCVVIVSAGANLRRWKPAAVAENTLGENDVAGLALDDGAADADSSMPPTSLSTFLMGDIIASLCPGICKCVGGDDGESLSGAAARQLAASLFPRLTPQQRKDPKLEITGDMIGAHDHGQRKGTAAQGMGMGSAPMSRQTTADGSVAGRSRTASQVGMRMASGMGSRKSITSAGGSVAPSVAASSRGGGSTAGGAGAGGAMTAGDLAGWLSGHKKKGGGKGGSGGWDSDPTKSAIKVMKSRGSAAEREERIKKRREELLSLLS